MLTSCFISLGAMMIFVWFASALIGQRVPLFDFRITDWVQSFVNPNLTVAMKFLTFMGSGMVVISMLILSILFMIWKKKRWEAGFLLIATSGGALLNHALKWVFHRQRPTLHRLIEVTGYSFPSGHAMNAIIFYGMLAFLLFLFIESNVWKWNVTGGLFCLIMLIGLSRIYLGVHYPSDVLAGFAAGIAWLAICLMGLRGIVLEEEKGPSKKVQNRL